MNEFVSEHGMIMISALMAVAMLFVFFSAGAAVVRITESVMEGIICG